MLAQEEFHLVFEVELLLFEGEFFDLFGLGKILPIRVVVKPFVEIVMLGGEPAKLLVVFQELALQLF